MLDPTGEPPVYESAGVVTGVVSIFPQQQFPTVGQVAQVVGLGIELLKQVTAKLSQRTGSSIRAALDQCLVSGALQPPGSVLAAGIVRIRSMITFASLARSRSHLALVANTAVAAVAVASAMSDVG